MKKKAKRSSRSRASCRRPCGSRTAAQAEADRWTAGRLVRPRPSELIGEHAPVMVRLAVDCQQGRHPGEAERAAVATKAIRHPVNAIRAATNGSESLAPLRAPAVEDSGRYPAFRAGKLGSGDLPVRWMAGCFADPECQTEGGPDALRERRRRGEHRPLGDRDRGADPRAISVDGSRAAASFRVLVVFPIRASRSGRCRSSRVRPFDTDASQFRHRC